MFSVVKVRENLAPGHYKDPGPYKNPPGTVAYEFVGNVGEAPQAPPNISRRKSTIELDVVKPGTSSSSHEH
jgi:manganese oxidase